VVDVRGDLLDMAEMHVLIIATVVAASFVHIWTIALGARICRMPGESCCAQGPVVPRVAGLPWRA
jgi:hypothetical protein